MHPSHLQPSASATSTIPAPKSKKLTLKSKKLTLKSKKLTLKTKKLILKSKKRIDVSYLSALSLCPYYNPSVNPRDMTNVPSSQPPCLRKQILSPGGLYLVLAQVYTQ
ncbi:hypothetical protein ST47_g1472 [Ascochyta rabiei]|uniref:Uncharacterized protein n=1 Tax=Didymella rabiei TaxID=5454 RepID=A0A163KZX6_DIDRA|nr:hypothetical protein ST47_g1472 [Ascochyta rabiei]